MESTKAMGNGAGWRGSRARYPRDEARAGAGAGGVQHPGELRGSGGTPGTRRGTPRDQGQGRGGFPSRALRAGAQPCRWHRCHLCPAAGLLCHSGRARQGAASLLRFPPANRPEPLPWSCSPSFASTLRSAWLQGALNPPCVPAVFPRVSPGVPPPCVPMCPLFVPGVCPRVSPVCAPLCPPCLSPHPARSPPPIAQTTPGEGGEPRGAHPQGVTARPDSFGGPVCGVRPPPVPCSATTPDGSTGASSLPFPVPVCPPNPPAPRAGSPRTGLAPSRRCCAELRGCRRLFSCRFPLSHLPNKSKRGHRLAVSTHTLISGEAAGGAAGNGSSSPSGGAVASTGGWSGPGITRGNLERVLCRIPLMSLSFRRCAFARLRLVSVSTGCSRPGCTHPRLRAERDPSQGRLSLGEASGRWDGGPGIVLQPGRAGGAIKASPITATRGGERKGTG